MRLGKGSTEISLYCLYWKRKIYIVTSATLNKSLFSEMTSPLLLNQVKQDTRRASARAGDSADIKTYCQSC